ncbi:MULTISPECIES: transposase [unclassified Methylobacterium]|uniref:transposase n=1 Tax=unclassified Methylobacterium TaxID=2615210 RepID=UPI0036FCEC20
MLPLPTRFAGLILAFAPLFVHRSWQHAQFLLIGTILTPGRRTVASVLRIMGRADERRFVNVHRILNRAAWCPRTGGRILFGLLIGAFAPHGPVVLGLTAVWRHGGLPVVPIRWVLIRDPEARFPPQALLCTDTTREPAQIVGWFVRRWSVEVTFQEVRAHLGVETRAAVVRHGDRPHHALPARPVLHRHAAGRTAPGPSTAMHRNRRVVPQTTPDLRRCPGRRALRNLARADFGDITAPTRPNKTPLPLARALGLCPLPRSMSGQSRA